MPKAKPQPKQPGAWITLRTDPRVIGDLMELKRNGLFGSTVEEVAEELLRERVRELHVQGFIQGRSGVTR